MPGAECLSYFVLVQGGDCPPTAILVLEFGRCSGARPFGRFGVARYEACSSDVAGQQPVQVVDSPAFVWLRGCAQICWS